MFNRRRDQDPPPIPHGLSRPPHRPFSHRPDEPPPPPPPHGGFGHRPHGGHGEPNAPHHDMGGSREPRRHW